MLNSLSIRQSFHAYYTKNQKYIEKNSQTIYRELDTWVEKELLDADQFSEFIIKASHGKKSLKKFIDGFLASLPIKPETPTLDEMVIIDDPTRRIFEEIKYLSVKRTKEELSRHFGINIRTVNRDVLRLLDGVEFLDTKIQIGILDINHKQYLLAYQEPVLSLLSPSLGASITTQLYRLADYDALHSFELKAFALETYNHLSEGMKKEITDFPLERARRETEEYSVDQAQHEDLLSMLHGHKVGHIEYYDEKESFMVLNRCIATHYNLKTSEITFQNQDTLQSVNVKIDAISECRTYKETKQL